MSFLVNELMKPQWMVFCGKVALSDQFTVILRVSTLDILPTEPLHLFLVHSATANQRGGNYITIVLRSQEHAPITVHRGSAPEPQLVSGSNFATSSTRTSEEEVGGGSSGRREQGEVLLW